MSFRWLFAACKVGSAVSLGIAGTAFMGHVLDMPQLYKWYGQGMMAKPTALWGMFISAITFGLSYGMREIEKEQRKQITKSPTGRSKKLERS